VAVSVPAMAAKADGASGVVREGTDGSAGSRAKLYSMPACCCSSVKPTPKSKLKSPPKDEAQGNVHPMRCLKASSLASGAREIAQNLTSRFSRWGTMPLNPSAIAEQEGQPAL
jgi:hypothetical protein